MFFGQLSDHINKNCPLCQNYLFSEIRIESVSFNCENCLHYSSFYEKNILKSEFFRISNQNIICREWFLNYKALLYCQSEETTFYYGEIRNYLAKDGLGKIIEITSFIEEDSYDINKINDKIETFLLLI